MGEIVAVVVSVVTLGGRGLLGLIVLLGILEIVGGLELGGILIFVGLDVLIIGLLLADVVLEGLGRQYRGVRAHVQLAVALQLQATVCGSRDCTLLASGFVTLQV